MLGTVVMRMRWGQVGSSFVGATDVFVEVELLPLWILCKLVACQTVLLLVGLIRVE